MYYVYVCVYVYTCTHVYARMCVYVYARVCYISCMCMYVQYISFINISKFIQFITLTYKFCVYINVIVF